MKHPALRWNPQTQEWFCTRCFRTSDHITIQDAELELSQLDCICRKARALLVDDEPNILFTLGLVLKSEGFDVQKAESAEIAKSYLLNASFDLVVTDLNLEHPLSGFEIVVLAKQKPVKPAIIVISGFYEDLAAWNQHGADAALPKPTDTEELLKTIDRLLPHRESTSG